MVMPITYWIDSQQQVIFERWSGDVSASDLARYWRGYLADPQVMAIRKTVVDLRESNPTFSGAELAGLIDTIVRPTLAGRDWITAIVVDKPVQFGISRQYQIFAEFYSQDAIFHDLGRASEWVLGFRRS
jgi:hypothetical protein